MLALNTSRKVKMNAILGMKDFILYRTKEHNNHCFNWKVTCRP